MIPLVLLPGMMCDGRMFGPQVAVLGLRRAVHLAPITEHSSIPDLAAAVLRHAPPRFALAGLSMGGIVAMQIAAVAPERVERLALLDTNPLAEPPEKQALRAPQMARARAGDLRGVIRDEMKPLYLAEGPGKQAVLDLCMEMALDLGVEVFIRQSQALRDRTDRTGLLRALRVKTLVLCGREDRLCPVARHEMIHGLIAGSSLEIIDGAGHLPTLERPEQTIATLRRWLEE